MRQHSAMTGRSIGGVAREELRAGRCETRSKSGRLAMTPYLTTS